MDNHDNFFKISNIYNYCLTCRRRTVPCMTSELQAQKIYNI